MDRRRSTSLLDAIYGMDLRAPDWGPLLTLLAATFRSHVVALQVHDKHPRRGRLTQSIGLSDALLKVHRNTSCQRPWFERGVGTLLSQGIADDRGLMEDDELRATRYHAEFMQPAGIAHGMALCLYQHRPGDLAVLTINRGAAEGCFDEAELALARSLLPHLRNVYVLQQRLSWLEGQSQRFRSTLDQLSKGVAMLDAGGHLLFCNSAAGQMEAGRLFARHPDGRLTLPHAPDDHRLQQALAKLAADMAAPPTVLQIHSRAGQLCGMLKLCPADMLAGAQWSESRVSVIAFIKPLELPAGATLTPTLRTQWGFTPAEARLAERLMEGLSLDEAAECTHVTKNTVRTQLRSLFDKTETRRQSQLVRVLLELSYV